MICSPPLPEPGRFIAGAGYTISREFVGGEPGSSLEGGVHGQLSLTVAFFSFGKLIIRK